jgi:hypothetical protein
MTEAATDVLVVQNIASGMILRVYGRSYAIEAELSVPKEGAEGVILAEADEMGGFSLWVDGEGRLHHSYSMMGVEQYTQVSSRPIPRGDVTVRMQFDADTQERSAGGAVSLYANGEKIGDGRLERTVFFRFSGSSGMDIGRDNGLPVDRAYADRSPYPVHRHGEEGRLRPQAGRARRQEGIASGTRPWRGSPRDQRLDELSVRGASAKTPRPKARRSSWRQRRSSTWSHSQRASSQRAPDIPLPHDDARSLEKAPTDEARHEREPS